MSRKRKNKKPNRRRSTLERRYPPPRPKPAPRRAPQVIPAGHRRRLLATFADHSKSDAPMRRMCALRDRAMIVLAWSSSLRLSECLALDVDQLIYDPTIRDARKSIGIVGGFELRPDQAKGENGGHVSVPRAARDALRSYLKEATRLEWLERWSGPLFVASKRSNGQRHRLKKRAAQFAWDRWQSKTGEDLSYTWHDLRHTAVTRFSESCGGNVYQVAKFARHKDVRTSVRYVHVTPDEIDRRAEEMQP